MLVKAKLENAFANTVDTQAESCRSVNSINNNNNNYSNNNNNNNNNSG